MFWLLDVLLQRLLQCRPRIYRQGNQLIAVTGWRTQILCLGFAGRKVVVDPDAKLVRLTQRAFWFATYGKVYTYDRILYVLSGYRDWSLSGLSVSGAYRETGVFTVELRLTTGERIVLFRFFDEGAFTNEGFLPDAMYWQDYVNSALTTVDQGTAADNYAKLVAGLIGVRIHSD